MREREGREERVGKNLIALHDPNSGNYFLFMQTDAWDCHAAPIHEGGPSPLLTLPPPQSPFSPHLRAYGIGNFYQNNNDYMRRE